MNSKSDGPALARRLVTLVCGVLVGCSSNPCPSGMRPDTSSDRCVPTMTAELVDAAGTTAPAGNEPTARVDAQVDAAKVSFDAGQEAARDAAPESWSEAAVSSLRDAAELADAAPPTSTMQGAKWPDGRVTLCWSPETLARADFPLLAPAFRAAVESSWPTAAAITLGGFQPCAGVTAGVVGVTLRDGDAFEVSEGYLGSGSPHQLTVGITRGAGVTGGLLPHALAHLLGLSAPHAHAACTSEPAPTSTLPERGDCRPRGLLSASDRAAARAVYGPRALGPGHRPTSSFDGDGADDVAFVEPSLGKPSGVTVRVELSAGNALGAAGSGGWLELATAPADLRVGDYDGDGLVDFGFVDAAHRAFEVRLSSGTAFAATSDPAWALALDADSKVLVGDFDRSGSVDVAQVKPNRQLWLAKSSLNGFAAWQRWEGAADAFGDIMGRHMVGDFNGDGYDDLAFMPPIEELQTYAAIYVHVCDAGGVLRGSPTAWTNRGDFGGFVGLHYIGNFRADAYDDFGYYEHGDGSFWVVPSTGRAAVGSTYWLEQEEGRQLADIRLIGNFDAADGDDLLYFDARRKTLRLFFQSEGEWLLERPSTRTMPYDPSRVLLATSSRESLGR